MRKFTDATRLDTTDPVNYPNGQLKDATTSTAKDGTLINKTLLADIRTVFTRALKLTGIVPNGNFDTDNSSQLFDACFGTTKVPITTFYNGVSGVKLGGLLITDPIRVWKSNGGKNVNIEGWIFNGSGLVNGLDLFQIPVGYRPIKDIFIWAISTDANYKSGSLLYNHTTGDVCLNVNISGNDGMYHYINTSIPLD